MKQISTDTGICFFRTHGETGLSEFLNRADFTPLKLNLKTEEWLREGCIYLDGRRQREETRLHAGQVVRVHTRPKRFPFPFGELEKRILFQNDSFLVLDKPADFPTHPTLDNFRENAKVRLEEELKIPLYTTHRLDVPTQGLLILAKSTDAQSRINKAFSRGRVDKTYRAISLNKVRGGHHVHYMDPESRVPKTTSLNPIEGWWRCELLIDRCEPHAAGFGSEIILLTGKTHQVRAQMRALGAPLLGDPVYGGSEYPNLMLECYRMRFSLRGEDFEFTRMTSILES